jgi:thiol:disulfide interchange protein DsbC
VNAQEANPLEEISMKGNRLLSLALTVAALAAAPASGFMGDGTGPVDCTKCHTLPLAEAQEKLGKLVDQVLAVNKSEVPGLFAVDVEKQGRKLPVYLDYSKRFLLTGDVIDLETMQSLVRERMVELNRIDPATVPVDDAVVIGDPKAPKRIIVFDDPECPFCKKIHPEMKKVVEERKDVAFFVKMLPLKIHPDARRKAKAIICAKSAEMLQDSLDGKPVPDPSCETDQVEKNEAVAQQIGVGSTPTLIFPDGRIIPGYKPADKIIALLDEGKTDKAAK